MATRPVYQFKITLKGIRPPIWRRIQVSDLYSFWDLHVAIQDAMGWFDCHLHVFQIQDPLTGERLELGIPDDLGELKILPDWDYKIRNYLTPEHPRMTYEYDFGDSWRHSVVLEAVCEKVPGKKYPAILGGRRACPPEDVGGIWGYEHFREIIADPGHPEYRETMAWAGGNFDPERFNPANVHFSSPRARLKYAFEDHF